MPSALSCFIWWLFCLGVGQWVGHHLGDGQKCPWQVEIYPGATRTDWALRLPRKAGQSCWETSEGCVEMVGFTPTVWWRRGHDGKMVLLWPTSVEHWACWCILVAGQGGGRESTLDPRLGPDHILPVRLAGLLSLCCPLPCHNTQGHVQPSEHTVPLLSGQLWVLGAHPGQHMQGCFPWPWRRSVETAALKWGSAVPFSLSQCAGHCLLFPAAPPPWLTLGRPLLHPLSPRPPWAPSLKYVCPIWRFSQSWPSPFPPPPLGHHNCGTATWEASG